MLLWKWLTFDALQISDHTQQARFYVMAGPWPASPNIFYKASKHQHIGAKSSVLWPSKYDKMRFRPKLQPGPCWRSLWRSPGTPSRLGFLPSHIPTQRLLRRLDSRTVGTSVWWIAHPPNIFLYNRVWHSRWLRRNGPRFTVLLRDGPFPKRRPLADQVIVTVDDVDW